MRRRHVIGALATNFLGTLVSRNSDIGGYWAFGVLLAEGLIEEIDLLSEVLPDWRRSSDLIKQSKHLVDPDQPSASSTSGPGGIAFVILARQRFRDQMEKLGLLPGRIQSAGLSLRLVGPPHAAMAGTIERLGHDVLIHLRILSSTDLEAELKYTLFVAPHDALREARSTRVAG